MSKSKTVPVKEPTDDYILALLKQPTSHEQGFRLLVQAYQERLYWHVRRLVINHEDTNDVLQNIFIKIHKNIQQFKGNSQLYTWIYRIASNEAITFLNKQKKRAITSIDNSTTLRDTLRTDPYFDGDAAQIKLQVALAQLPDKQRLVFIMRYYEELSYEEISKIVETSVGALKASYHHAVKKVEAALRRAAEEL